ncbi:hypothetical protein LTR53_000913 [Teratosphaeriaceae sp. CCFEE 6253]|nr:hypothetical protein LTR53_000913 [Teratosphaeriaceae sp. CCFEE 6253]
MGKRTVYTKVTPLPSHIPRQLALDMLHSHEEMIKLNPLVTGVKAIEAPRDARSDEFFSQWYEISEIITWGFGLRKKISFKGCFHTQPWGLQSHVYAPMGVDMRNKYHIGGNQPGEAREARELGVNTPLDGLYLREDVEITCGVPLTASFVKKEAQAATGIMIDRLTRKAELLDAGMLHAMFQDGMLKTSKPNDDPTFGEQPLPSPNGVSRSPRPGEPSPRLDRTSTFGTLATPTVDGQGFGRYHDVVQRNASQRNSYVPQYQQQGYQGPDHTRPGAELAGMPEIMELPGSFYQPDQQPQQGLYPPPLKSHGGGQSFVSELPGDFVMPAQRPPSVGSQPQPAGNYQTQQQAPHRASPNLPDRAASTSSSTYSGGGGGGGSGGGGGYHIANPGPQRAQPPQQQHPAHRQTPPQSLHDSHHPQQPLPTQRHTSFQSLPSQLQYQQQQQMQQPQYGGSYRPPSGSSAQIADWQRGMADSAHGEDPNSIRNSIPSTVSYAEPDHQRFSQMSVQNTPPVQHAQLSGQQVQGGGLKVSKCPVCGLFEGDEAAITHHVSKAHFA